MMDHSPMTNDMQQPRVARSRSRSPGGRNSSIPVPDMSDSWWLKFLDKTNFTVTILTVLSILYTRSAGFAYFSAGALICVDFIKTGKRVFRQPRPDPIHPQRKKTTYGMPSTHSAAITFYATYISLACYYLPIHRNLPPSILTRIVPVLISIPWAAAIVYSRIRLGHHTWAQASVGSLCGFLFARVWFEIWVINDLHSVGQDVELLLEGMLKGRTS